MLKIYRIVDNTNGNIYIGKTTQTLKQRLSKHKYKKSCMSRDIIKNGDYRIELIEETDDINRERYWILNTECINKQIPGGTRKEYYENNKDIAISNSRNRYINNKDVILQKQKEYYESNIDKVKEYREKNKEKFKEESKKYRENNKEYFQKKNKQYKIILYNWQISMGGRIDRNNNSLIKIDPNLFF